MAGTRKPGRRRETSRLRGQSRRVTKAASSLLSFIRRESKRLGRLKYHLWPLTVARMSQATELLKELTQFSTPDLTSLPAFEQYRTALSARRALIRSGIADKKGADAIVDLALRKAPGRPETIRSLTSAALALKESRRTLTWRAIAKKLAPDNYPVHGTPLAKRITRNVRLLRALLRRIDAFIRASSADS